MERLKFELLDDDLDLFSDNSQEEEIEENHQSSDTDESNENNTEEIESAEVDPDKMFEEETPESVGSEDNNGEDENALSDESSASPKFFSSIANAFAEEGIFPDLTEERIKEIKTAKDLREAIIEQIQAGLDEEQQRVSRALNAGIEPDKIRQFKQIMDSLNVVSEEELKAEGEEGDNLRKQILFRDYINHGLSEDRAKKAVERAFNNGTEVEEATEALQSMKDFYQTAYQELLDNAEAERKEEIKKQEETAERLKKSMLTEKLDFLSGVDLDKNIRSAAFDAISKPVYKDPKTGNVYTAIDKIRKEDGENFLKKLGFLYVLTDGFKSLDSLAAKKASKEIKKGLSKLESTLNTTQKNPDGSLRFVSGTKGFGSAFNNKNVKLDF